MQTLAGATSSNFDGAGFGSCRVADDCETLDKQEQEVSNYLDDLF